MDPVWLTFVASLLLSWAAQAGRLVNRDGILYLDTARTVLEQGISGLREIVGFNFLPALLAMLAAILPLELEALAKVLDALFMAGTCALLVAWIREKEPDAAWFAAFVVLAMPAYNQYRNEILREYGFWFFSLLGMWLAARWDKTKRWQDALNSQIALALAALFRLEALAFFLALMFWQGFSSPAGEKVRKALTITALPLGLLLLIALMLLTGSLQLPPRVDYYLLAANPFHKVEIFSAAATKLSDLVLPYKYSREEAVFILLIGLLAIIPLKFFKMLGILILPFVYRLKVTSWRQQLRTWQPLPWAFVVYLIVLTAFVTHNMFLVGRYVSLLNLLAVPLVALGFMQLVRRFPRWRWLLMALTLATLVANVVSTTPRQNHILAAAKWLRENADGDLRVGSDSSRIAYYTGWRMAKTRVDEQQQLIEALVNGDLDIVALEVGRKDGMSSSWEKQMELVTLERFSGAKGDTVVVLGRNKAAPPSATQ